MRETKTSLEQIQSAIANKRCKTDEEAKGKGQQEAEIQALKNEIKAKQSELKDLIKSISGIR